MLEKSTNSISISGRSTARSAISKVATQAAEISSTSSTSDKDGSKLAALRPGSLSEEISNQKKSSENSENKDDKGEVAKSDKEDSRTYTNSRESENQAIINRIWGKNGALSGLKSNNYNGIASDIGSYTSLSSGSALARSDTAGLLGASSKGGAGLTSSPATSIDGGASSGVPLARTGGSSGGGSGATQAHTTNSRQFIDNHGNVINIDGKDNTIDRKINPNDDSIRGNPEKFNHDKGGKDPYEQNKKVEPNHKPTGTGEKLESYKSKMSEEDQKLYDKLDKHVKVYRNDSVGFGTDLDSADKSREADPDKREQAIAVLVDTIKKESPEVQEKILANLDKWGKEDGKEMEIFLSDKLSFGMDKSVGGFVKSAEGIGSKMALPLDLSDYTHTDIARHEGVHWKDVLSDGELDGLVAGEDKRIQDLMLSAMRKFENGEYDKDKIEKLDIGNLRYGSGYTRKLDSEGEGKKLNPDDLMSSNRTLALAEARAVLEQEFADKPDEFRAVGGEFAKLADHWDDNVAKYDPKSKENNESNVVKDGKEDGTNNV